MSVASAGISSVTPSSEIARVAARLVPKSQILDAPCGFGRNSLYLAELGHRVIGVDCDMPRLSYVEKAKHPSHRIELVACDLNAATLPFRAESFDALLIVHFIPAHWENLSRLLRPSGVLVVETMGGQGGNYLELPKVGYLRSVLAQSYELERYVERRVGPAGCDAVSVKLLATKRKRGARTKTS